MNKIEVLYLSYDGLTDPLGQSQILPYIVGLSKEGYRVTIISVEKQERFQSGNEAIKSICSANDIVWHPLTYTKRPPVLSTVYDIFRMRRLAFGLFKQRDFKIIHCRSYIAALIGLALKKKKKTTFVFDMRGFWADERIDGGLWKLTNPLYRFIYRYFKKKEVAFLNKADYVISLTQNAALEIHSWKHIKNQPIPIEVIPCSADMELFNPDTIRLEDKEQLRTRLGIAKNDFVLSYIGSIGTWYMLDEMLDFFVVLKEKKPHSKFLFITNDPVASIREKAIARGIRNEDIIITQSPRNQMPLYISLSDYTLFFIKPSYSKKASSPVKQGEAMSMGVPIICNSGVGDTDMIVKRSKAGLVINEFNKASYEKACDAISSNQKLFDTSDIIKGAQHFYSSKKAISMYAGVYRRVLDAAAIVFK